MKIPETIQIAGLTYDIKKIAPDSVELCSGNANGLHSFQNCCIFLNKEMNEQQMRLSLIHELTHAVNDALNVSFTSIEIDERYVESFSRIWYQILEQL